VGRWAIAVDASIERPTRPVMRTSEEEEEDEEEQEEEKAT
jgi:hypothetical protein